MVFVYMALFQSVNQHSISYQPISIWYLIRPHPHGVHKPWYTLCSLHSDSNHQMDNKSHTQPLISSMSISSSTHCVSMYQQIPGTHFHCMLHQLYSTRCIHLHLQGKFLHLSGRLSGTFCTARSWSQHVLSISDGGSQFPVHPSNAKACGLHPVRHPPEPGRT